jgi:DNA repair exonuclease SbcCD nuclease subunit
MKILFFSDLHLANHGQFSIRLPSGLNSRLVDGLNVVDQAAKICQEKKIDACVFLGDLYHHRARIETDVLVLGYLAMQRLARSIKRLLVVVGNHDQNARLGDLHSLEAMKQFATVVDAPWENPIDGLTVAAVPYVADLDRFREAIAVVGEADLLLLHQPIAEALPSPTNSQGKVTISLSDIPFDRVRYAISGDIHKRQWLANGRFLYVGSPMQHNFGERYDTKSFTLLDTETWTFEEIATDAPRFWWYEFDGSDRWGGEADPTRDFIRVSYQERDKEAAEKMRAQMPRVQFEMVRVDAPVFEQRASDAMVSDDRALLQGYMDLVGVGDLDPDRLLNVGLTELQRVESWD